jgi:sugar phosphate permease
MVAAEASPRRILALAVASQSTLSVVQWGLGAMGPQLAHRYGLSAAALGALLSAGSIGNCLMLVPAGGIVDRFGPRAPLLVGGIAVGVLLVAGGYAPSPWLLGAVLVLSGVAGALVGVAGAVSIFHEFAAERRGFALGIRQGAVAFGGLLAAIFLPGLAALGGVGLSFAVSGVLTAVCAVAFALASPRGALHGDARSAGFAPVAVMRTPGMLRLLVVGLCYVAVLTSVLTFAVPALHAEGASTVEASVLFGVISVAAVLARLSWGRLADAGGGTRRRATARDVGLVALVGALVYWPASQAGVAVALPAMALFAFGALGFNGVLYVVAGELAGGARAGQAVGFMSTVLFGGSALAAIPLGYLADAEGYSALWPAAAVLALLGVLATLGLQDRPREPYPAPARG